MFWRPGEHIYWHYRRPRWQPGDAEYVDPLTVVRDDERGLVAWLAPGTEVLKSVLPDGRPPRSAPAESAFSIGRVSARGRWQGPGILRIAPSGLPWSVWLFWDPAWHFEGWYVNLEAPHRREGRHLFSSDHVLDVWIGADNTVRMKDEDELDAAVEQGLFSTADGQRITEDARAAIETFRAGDFPFDEPWRDWRPDPGWPRPVLPAEANWVFDQLDG
ncbi:MAG: DUF402 domain-containing protein [Nocardioides sp.]